MALTLGKTKWQRFESYIVLAIAIVGIPLYFGFKYISAEFGGLSDSEKSVEGFVQSAAKQHTKCEWYGAESAHGHSIIFVGCNPTDKLEGEIKNEADLYNVIEKHVISHSIGALPTDEAIEVVVATSVRKGTVACAHIAKRKITKQWLDTFENYCGLNS